LWKHRKGRGYFIGKFNSKCNDQVRVRTEPSVKRATKHNKIVIVTESIFTQISNGLISLLAICPCGLSFSLFLWKWHTLTFYHILPKTNLSSIMNTQMNLLKSKQMIRIDISPRKICKWKANKCMKTCLTSLTIR
jgi:hypothetical protein